MTKPSLSKGFTLIELSIVLVIIGLIVGGVLVGQDLIRAAAVRAQVTQIEKFNTAVNTFKGKYGYLPGDIKDPDATNFGFPSRGAFEGEGDGNGVLEGMYSNGPAGSFPAGESAGETVMFWVDLSIAHLIDGNFATANTNSYVASDITGSQIRLYFPEAKIGLGNFVYAFGGGFCCGGSGNGWNPSGINYFGLSGVTAIANTNYGYLNTAPTITVSQAYSIDKKIDDGYPQTGNVTAQYSKLNSHLSPDWAGTVDSSATPASSATCYDNGGNAGMQHYSLQVSSGSNVNCALSFRFQ